MTVVGARPQFIKCAALSKELRTFFDEIIVHTGQHYDTELSGDFFLELQIPQPDFNLSSGQKSGIEQIADIMVKLNAVVQSEKPDCIVIFGDTNSTAAAAIVAVKNQIKLAHIEAGMREFDKTIPEESNKLIADILTDYYFCPTPAAVGWLKEMGITQHVFQTGDIMIDLMVRFSSKISNNTAILTRFKLIAQKYIFATCHRATNTENKNHLEQILKAFIQLDIPVVFPMHPRTMKATKAFRLDELINHKNIILCEPLGYFDTQSLIKNAAMVITDSGGVTKECYFYGVPGILIDKQTEWIETVAEGCNIQAGPHTKKILEAYHTHNIRKPSFKGNHILGNGSAARKIVLKLKELLN